MFNILLVNKLQKSQIYHKILSTILSSFIKAKSTGLIWNLKYPDIIKYQVQLLCLLALCIVDMKRGYQLCRMYDKYFGFKCACISCY